MRFNKWSCVMSLTWLVAAAGLAPSGAQAQSIEVEAWDSTPVLNARSGRTITAMQRQMLAAIMAERGISYDAEGRPLAARCFVENPTPEQFEYIMNTFQALPPTLINPAGLPSDRYFTANTVWSGTGATGSSGQAARVTLTYSFPADGVSWGDGSNGPIAPNNLSAQLTSLFGAGNLDRGREFIRQGLASWRKVGGLTYNEIADDGAAYSTAHENVTTRGNVRIGSNPQGNTGVLAYNYFPGASDMAINSDEFPVGNGTLGSAANTYRYFRNVVAHEHGHGLGYIHPTPCNQTKLMEPFASTAFEMTQIDEWRGLGRNYGDRFAGNNSGATAKDFGDLTTPSVKSIVEQRLSTNGTTGPSNSDEDWFKFTLSSSQAVVITAVPTGGSYQNGQQTGGCNPSNPGTINAGSAANLNVELRTGANGATVAQTAAAAAAGATETLNAGTLAAGTYWVRVVDSATTAGTQTVQLYDLTIRVATSKAPPTAIAGLNKRVQAGTTCYFMGNLNSYTNDTGPGGGANSITTYAWDLDGDGTFEVPNNAVPTLTYLSNGTFPVALRVTDSNGLTATDTINVVVFGATTTVVSSVPNNGNTGQTVPVTINGGNLKGVTAASQVVVSGTGVTVTGTPSVNAAGTQISGLSFVIASNATLGLRNITINNSDGAGSSGTGNNLFTVNSGVCVPATVGSNPSPATGCVGGTVNLTAAGAGSSPFNYQWRKGLTNIGGATNATLTLSSLSAGDAGSYDCVITNACGNATTTAATVTVNTPVGITTQPISISRCPGTSATFSVASTGTDPRTFQWRKNTTNIGGATSSSFTIPSVVAGDSGTYDCVITNICGSTTSNSATLGVQTGVTITGHPTSQTVCEAEAVSFIVTADGGGPFTFQWKRNGNIIPNATGGIFNLGSPELTDAGSYTCVVTGGCGSTESNPAVLTVRAYPNISGQPVPVQACLGGPATFSITATGFAPLSQQWRKNGVDISGATGTSYTIPAVAAGDLGNYDCVVTNVCGSGASNPAALTLQTSLTFTGQPANVSACEGTAASMTVVVTGGTGLTYQWRKNTVDISGATTDTLAFPALSPADVASYDCVVTNTCGSVTSNAATVSLLGGPSIQTHPSSGQVCIGGVINLSVVAPGATTFQWRKAGSPLSNGPSGNGSTIAGAGTASLSISSAAGADAGSYDCVVGSTCGSTPSDAAVIQMIDAPTVTVDPANQSVCSGTSASFSVTATGSGTLTYQWRRNTLPIGGATASSLTINPALPINIGSYDCVVTNTCGSDTSLAANLFICIADFNCSGTISSQDIFDFLGAYFAGNAAADVNGSGSITSQDIFDFLGSYFAGCP